MTAKRQLGFSMLDIVIGLLIFVVGMLALASLQGQLTRSQADAALRSVATNIAEEQIELLRAFGRIDPDPADVIPAYADIQDGTTTVTVGAVDFTVTTEVTDYYYDIATDSFGVTNPDNLLYSDFKEVQLTVSWANALGFRVNEGVEISSADMGTGEITITEVVSSITTQGAGKGSAQETFQDLTPEVTYIPGQNPEVVSLELGNNKFKESTTPKPRVYRTEDLVETRFDVITYSQTDSGALFLRREEFITISCDCELAAAPILPELQGRRPTTWVGDEYDRGDPVVKPVGISVGPQQSQFCEQCCWNHHDGGTVEGDTAAARYNPFLAGSSYWDSGPLQGDHKHYGRDGGGNLVLADSFGDSYVEACRLVRVDGFMRVAQDLRQEAKNAFPEDYLDDDSEVDDYSQWATSGANTFENALAGDYETAPPTFPSPPLAPDVGGFPTSTSLPTPIEAVTQQLRSRSIYVDYLRDDLRAVIDCMRALPVESPSTDCESGEVKFDQAVPGGVLEVIPFFDVQLTWLDRWSEDPINDPIDTTNETVLTDNAHSRGEAFLTGSSGDSLVKASGHRGNLGLTDTDPTTPSFAAELGHATLVVHALTEAPPPEPGSVVISGSITSGVTGLRATELQIEGVNANCNRLPDGYACQFSTDESSVELKVYGYKKQGVVLAACSLTMTKVSSGVDGNGRGFSYFNLAPSPPLDPALSHDIWLTDGSCSGSSF